MGPPVSLEEITDLALSSARYKTKVVKGVLEVTTTENEDGWAKGSRRCMDTHVYKRDREMK